MKLGLFAIGVLLFIQAWRKFDGSFVTPWIIAFLISVVAIIIFEAVVARRYRCPSCGDVLKSPQVDSDRSNEYYHDCAKCDTRWYTKTFPPSD